VVLWLDDREWTGALRRTGAEWVSAEIRIARADRSTLPVHGELDIDVLPPDGASPSADA
jgi:hypothetical protein